MKHHVYIDAEMDYVDTSPEKTHTIDVWGEPIKICKNCKHHYIMDQSELVMPDRPVCLHGLNVVRVTNLITGRELKMSKATDGSLEVYHPPSCEDRRNPEGTCGIEGNNYEPHPSLKHHVRHTGG